MIIHSIREILKARHLDVIAPWETVRAACALLAGAKVGALAVIDGARLVGVLTERDIVQKCVAKGRRTDETLVAEIMTPDPVTIAADDAVADAMDAMTKAGVRHLPVMDGDCVLGMLSMRDIPTDYRLMFERFTEYRTGHAPSRAG